MFDQDQGPRRTRGTTVTEIATRAQLFLTSYAALFAILALRFDGSSLRLACIVLSVAGLVVCWLILRAARRRSQPVVLNIDSVRDVSGEVSGYLATYLLPFVTVSSPDGADLLAYSLFLIVVLVVYVRTDLVHVNPTLYLLGYQVVSICHDGRSEPSYLIARTPPRAGERVAVVRVANLHVVVRSSH